MRARARLKLFRCARSTTTLPCFHRKSNISSATFAATAAATMPLPRPAACVNSCFRRVEKAADWLVGRAGPIFVVLCTLLVGMGAWTYFVLVLPAVTPPSDPSWVISRVAFPLLLAASLFIVYCIAWSYRSACLRPPGLVSTFAENACLQSRDDVEQVTALWQAYTRRAIQASRWIQDSSSDAILANYRRVAEDAGATVEEMADEDLWPRVKMCMKCKPIPLWQAMAILPPELRDVERRNRERAGGGGNGGDGDGGGGDGEAVSQLRSRGSSPAVATGSGGSAALPSSSTPPPPPSPSSPLLHALRDSILEWLPASQADTLVPPPKPERTHHCSICKTCIVKYDHHCPWLNQCVGLYNERYFMMFLFWLSFGCMVVVATGWRPFYRAAHLFEKVSREAAKDDFARSSASNKTDHRLSPFIRQWSHPLVPRPFMLLIFILSLVMGLCLIVMGGNHLLLVSNAETSVENADADQYKHLARRKGRQFRNVYDVGRRNNLALFWNLTPQRSYWHVLLPYHYPPYSDGWHWAKRRGLGGYNWGVGADEEFTDDEEQEGQGQGEIVGRVPKSGGGGGGGDDVPAPRGNAKAKGKKKR